MQHLSAFAVYLAMASPALATLPPCVQDDLMREAVLVMQITDQNVTYRGRNICRLTGTISQVHRGQVDVGRSLQADFPCLEDSSELVVGATIYSDRAEVTNAAAVEVHIGSNGLIAAYGAGLLLLEGLTASIAWQPFCD